MFGLTEVAIVRDSGIVSLNKFFECFEDKLGAVLASKVSDLFSGQTCFFKMAFQPFPNRFSFFAFAQVEFRDRLLCLLDTNGIAILVVILDDLFLISAVFRGHGGKTLVMRGLSGSG